jgi:hypothetical protein
MGRRSPRRAPEEELERMLGLFRDKYVDFAMKHFHEQLQKALGEVIGEHGFFCALCTDRGSHYFYTPNAGAKVSKVKLPLAHSLTPSATL